MKDMALRHRCLSEQSTNINGICTIGSVSGKQGKDGNAAEEDVYCSHRGYCTPPVPTFKVQ